MDAYLDQFIAKVRAVVGHEEQIALHEPDISEIERLRVLGSLDSGFVSTAGPLVSEFEEQLANFVGTNFAVTVSSGTAALHLALIAAGVEPGDEVFVPTLSFVATANAVSHAGAFPYFLDSESESLGMSPEILRIELEKSKKIGKKRINPKTGRKISAIVPIHPLGHMANIVEILKIANEFQIPVIEDAAESVGTYLQNKHSGSFGAAGVLSFNGNKIITTGGGGAIVTSDERLAAKVKHLSTTAKLPHGFRFFHDEVAWNYRMPNLNAALGVAQLSRINSLIEDKRSLARRYIEVFRDDERVNFISEAPDTKCNYWLNSVKFKYLNFSDFDSTLIALNNAGIGARPLWELLHTLPMYESMPRSEMPNAVSHQKSVISLPSSAKLARR